MFRTQWKGVSNPRQKLGWNALIQAHRPLKRQLCILPLNTRENCDLNILHKVRISLSVDKYTTDKLHLLTIRHCIFQRLCLPAVTGYWPLGVTSIIVTTNEFTAIPLPVEVLQLLKRKSYKWLLCRELLSLQNNPFLLKKLLCQALSAPDLCSECQWEPFLPCWTDSGLNQYLAAQEMLYCFVILQVPEDNQGPAVSN